MIRDVAAMVLAQHTLNPPELASVCSCGWDEAPEIEHPGHVAEKLDEAGLLALPAVAGR